MAELTRENNNYEERNDSKSLDGILERVGSFGRFQKLLLFLLGVPFAFNWTLNYWVHYLIMLTPPHHCHIPGVDASRSSMLIPANDQGVLDSCHRYNIDIESNTTLNTFQIKSYINYLKRENNLKVIPCDYGLDFNISEHFRTAVVEFGWACDNQWKKYTTQTMFFSGMLVGLLLFGILSDRYGRLPVTISTGLLAPIASIACLFCPNFYTFATARFLMGLTENSVFMMPLIIAMEYLPPQARKLVPPIAFGLFPATVTMLLPWISLWVGDWRSLLLGSGLLCLFLFIPPAFLFMPESASWLLTGGYVDRCLKSVIYIAKFNGQELDEKNLLEIKVDLENIKNDIDEQSTPSLRQIIKSRKVCFRLWICVVLSMIVNLLYDANVRNFELIPASSYVIFTMFGAVMIPSQFFAGVFRGRRTALILSFCVSCAITSSLAFIRNIPVIGLAVLVITLQFFLCTAYSTFSMMISEVLPTVIRARGISLTSCSGALAMCLSPQIIHLGTYTSWLPSTTFAALSITGGVATMLLPETQEEPLPHTLEDGEVLGGRRLSHRDVSLEAKNTDDST